MVEEKVLLEQLSEYNVALEHLQRNPPSEEVLSPRKIAQQLSYLEQRVLAVQTQLNRIHVQMQWPSHEQPDEQSQEGSWVRLNPWHSDFQAWAYIAALALFMLTMILVQVVLG
jgi:hypothetical protein